MKPIILRLFVALSTSVIAILTSSCGCCTSDTKPPKLRPMPSFKDIPSPPAQVEYTK